MADIFQEVEADLRAERVRSLLIRYGKLAGLALLVAALAAGAWQGAAWWQARRRMGVATAYFAAVQDLGTVNPSGASAAGIAKAEAGFARLTGSNTPAGYRLLARFRAAALASGNGQTKLALTIWQDIVRDRTSDPLYQGLARLLWVTHQIGTVQPHSNVQPLLAELRPLVSPGNPWQPMAEEATALIAMAQHDKAAAHKTLARLSSDPAAPQGVRARAAAMLSQLSE